jgi:hypothetical protein
MPDMGDLKGWLSTSGNFLVNQKHLGQNSSRRGFPISLELKVT